MRVEEAIKEIDINKKILNLLLKSKEPLPLKLLQAKTGLSVTAIHNAIKSLTTAGYDIKTIHHGREQLVSLVRFGSYSSKAFYRPLGRIRTPFILSADWHIGSKGFSELALKQLIDDAKKNDVKDICVAGDFFQGLGVYRLEMEDLLYLDVDSQLDAGIEAIKKFPSDINFHLIMGTHEEKLKGTYKVGFDLCKALAANCDNVNYYGRVAKLGLEDGSILLMHGTGGGAYAVTYKPQKVWDSLVEKPTILCIGHFHQLDVLMMPPNNYIVQPGTLQRESSWLISKGITAQLGWVVVKKLTKQSVEYSVTRPEVF